MVVIPYGVFMVSCAASKHAGDFAMALFSRTYMSIPSVFGIPRMACSNLSL